jgi:DNA-binding LytR/AlgR family response regulator
MINIAVVEDDKASANVLLTYIDKYRLESLEKITVSLFDNGINFLDEYKSQFDVVFMDIEMPHMNGIETARKLRQTDEMVSLIFVTNMVQYAISGYEVSALDFMVKPVGYFNFQSKLQRAIKTRQKLKKHEIVIKTEDGFKKISHSDIYYVEVTDHNLTYHTSKGTFRERETIKAREEQLKDFNFIKCNNCYLVNLVYVTEFNAQFVTVEGTRLTISRAKKKDFINALTRFMGEYKI